MRLTLIRSLLFYALTGTGCTSLYAPGELSTGKLIITPLIDKQTVKHNSGRLQNNFDNYSLTLTNTNDGKKYHFERLADAPNPLEMLPGEYKIELVSGSFTLPAFEKPQYSGIRTATVSPDATTDIELECKQTNVGVKLIYSEKFKELFSTYQTTISSSIGSLIYTNDDTRVGYFKPGELSFSMQINNKEYQFSKKIQGKAQELWTIRINAEGFENPTGNVSLSLILNTDVIEKEAALVVKPDDSNGGTKYSVNNPRLVDRALNLPKAPSLKNERIYYPVDYRSGESGKYSLVIGGHGNGETANNIPLSRFDTHPSLPFRWIGAQKTDFGLKEMPFLMVIPQSQYTYNPTLGEQYANYVLDVLQRHPKCRQDQIGIFGLSGGGAFICALVEYLHEHPELGIKVKACVPIASLNNVTDGKEALYKDIHIWSVWSIRDGSVGDSPKHFVGAVGEESEYRRENNIHSWVTEIGIPGHNAWMDVFSDGDYRNERETTGPIEDWRLNGFALKYNKLEEGFGEVPDVEDVREDGRYTWVDFFWHYLK